MDDQAGARAAASQAPERLFVLPAERFTWFGDRYWLNERSLTAKERRLCEGAGELDAAAVPTNFAERILRFPAAHPRQGALYLVHPAQRGTALNEQPVHYYPLDTFHPRTFESKVLEAIHVLASLGARRITAYAVQGYGPEVWLSSSDPGIVRGLPRETSEMSETSERAALVTFAREYPPPTRGALPTGLLWSPTDPQLRRIIQQRQSSSATSMQCFISYPEDCGVGATLAAQLGLLGFEPAELFHEFQRTIWQLDVAFWPGLQW